MIWTIGAECAGAGATLTETDVLPSLPLPAFAVRVIFTNADLVNVTCGWQPVAGRPTTSDVLTDQLSAEQGSRAPPTSRADPESCSGTPTLSGAPAVGCAI